jgi:5-methylcytosine-specific restriction endonuclease McrA
LHDKWQTARRLMRHRVPDGDLAAIVEQALDLLIDKQMKRHFAQVQRPRSTRTTAKEGSRHIPAAIRRAVGERDGMRCTFVSDGGHRCEARERLEYHHDRAFALGGEASVANIKLLCSAHNQLMAERDFGPLFMAEKRMPRDESRV